MTAPQFAGQVTGQGAPQICERLESQPESRLESKKLTGARTFLSAAQTQGGLVPSRRRHHPNPPSSPAPANRNDGFTGGIRP